MSLPNRVTQTNRAYARASYAGGAATIIYYSFTLDTGSADGLNGRDQFVVPWNCQVKGVQYFATNDPGATIIGIHIDRAAAADTQTLTPSGAAAVTLFPLLNAQLTRGQELAVSVDPANDPGVATATIILEFDSP